MLSCSSEVDVAEGVSVVADGDGGGDVIAAVTCVGEEVGEECGEGGSVDGDAAVPDALLCCARAASDFRLGGGRLGRSDAGRLGQRYCL